MNRKTSMILELLNNNVESDITDRKKFKRNNDSALCLYTILNQCMTRNGKKRLRSFILRRDFELINGATSFRGHLARIPHGAV